MKFSLKSYKIPGRRGIESTNKSLGFLCTPESVLHLSTDPQAPVLPLQKVPLAIFNEKDLIRCELLNDNSVPHLSTSHCLFLFET